MSAYLWSGIADSVNNILAFICTPWLGRISDAMYAASLISVPKIQNTLVIF